MTLKCFGDKAPHKREEPSSQTKFWPINAAHMKHEFQALRDGDPDDIDVVFDEGYHYLVKEQRKKKLRFAAVVLGALCLIVILAVVAGLSIFLPIYFTRYTVPEPPSYFRYEDIRETVEYQIALRPHDAWTDRETMINLWISTINHFSSSLKLFRGTSVVDYYRQAHLTTSGSSHCRTRDTKVRTREYLYSKKTVIDVKGGESDHDKEDSCNKAFWPSEAYYNVSSQKCEEDLHPCFSKYTRGTAVTIQDPHFQVKTCKELKNIFPDVFYKVNPSNEHNEVKVQESGYWYKREWAGIAGNHTHYQLVFTINYHEVLSEVLRGNVPIEEGEFSLRFWVDYGLKWEKPVVDDFQALFYQLLLVYDKDDEEHVDCANTFLNGTEFHGIKFDVHQDYIYDLDYWDNIN